MKKTILLLFVTYFSVSTTIMHADLNTTDIFIENKTTTDITVSQPIKQEHDGAYNPTGNSVTVLPGKTVKIASLGRDQSWYKGTGGKETTTSISFVTNGNRTHTLKSTWTPQYLAKWANEALKGAQAVGQVINACSGRSYYNTQISDSPTLTNPGGASKLYYNDSSSFPHLETGLNVTTKIVPFKLYKNVVLQFTPTKE